MDRIRGIVVSLTVVGLVVTLGCAGEGQETGPTGVGDVTPPDAVEELRVLWVQSTQVGLSWRATGDDGREGVASAYDVRYSTNAITESNWDAAVRVRGVPQSVGSTGSMELTFGELVPSTKYFVGVRAYDDAGNASEVAVVVVETADDGGHVPAAGLGFEDLAGMSRHLSEFQGKVILLNFWVTWCRPSQSEARVLEALHNEFKDRGLVVIGISLDVLQDRVKVREFVERHGLSYLIGYKPEQMPDEFEVRQIPTNFLINQNQQVTERWIGHRPDEVNQIREKIEALLEERP